MLRSLATVSGFTAMSRVLGFVRDIFLANFLGTKMAADAFVAAFRFPNMFRRIFGEGAFSAAFVPLFGRELEEKGAGEAELFASRSFTYLGGVLLVGTALALPGMEWIMAIFTQGFRERPETMALAVAYGRIAFSYLLCMALAAHLSGVLNTLRVYAMPALAPVLLNLVFLTGLGVVVPLLGFSQSPIEAGYVAVWCVFVAGFAQLAVLWVACWKKGMPVRVVWPKWGPQMQRLTVLMGPGVLSAGVQQVNLLVGTMIASEQVGALSYLYFADRLNQLPLGMIGIAFSTVLLTEITRALRKGEEAKALQTQADGIVNALFLTIPAAVALCLAAEPILRVLFERNLFTAVSTRETATALFWFATGLPAYVLVKVLQPTYFARENTKLPMVFAVVTVLVNVGLSLWLFRRHGHEGIAMATSFAGWVNVLLLFAGARDKLQLGPKRWGRIFGMLLASGLMGAGLAWALRFAAGWLEGTFLERALSLAGVVLFGMTVYAIWTMLFRVVSLSEVLRWWRRKK
ncbi:MAG: murein biosynthesis integral membrane protein MurJ [Verrucomicrobiota bacterium]